MGPLRTLLVAAALVATTATGALAAVPPLAEPAADALVTVTARLDLDATTEAIEADGDALLGRPLRLEITASAPREMVLFEPVRPATGGFTLIRPLPGTRKVEGDRVTETYRYELLPVRMGVEAIPPIEVPWRPAGADAGGSTSTPKLRVRVRGRLENEQNPALAPAPPGVPVIATNWVLVWLLSVGAALVLAALLTWFVLRALDDRFRALAPAPPPRPANEVAIERLDAIDAADADALDGAARLAETIDVLREYLGARYRFDALEMTTRELLAALAAPLADEEVTPAEVEALLAEADLVKFAKITPAEASARAKSATVRDIVERTWEPPEEEEEEEIPRLDPATVSQRYYAGGIDVAIAASAALLLFAVLWVAGLPEHGWTALLLLGALLVFRDALGRSIGKRILGLSIVLRRDRQPAPSPGRLVQRNGLLLLWPLTLPLEALVLRRHPLRLRLGDLAAETEVVQGGGAR